MGDESKTNKKEQANNSKVVISSKQNVGVQFQC